MSKVARILIGHRYDHWTVISDSGNYKCLCRCECGTERLVSKFRLADGATRSCGCMGRKQWHTRIKREILRSTNQDEFYQKLKSAGNR